MDFLPSIASKIENTGVIIQASLAIGATCALSGLAGRIGCNNTSRTHKYPKLRNLVAAALMIPAVYCLKRGCITIHSSVHNRLIDSGCGENIKTCLTRISTVAFGGVGTFGGMISYGYMQYTYHRSCPLI